MNEIKEVKQFCIERICELGDKILDTDKQSYENSYLDGKIDGYREVLRSLSVEFSNRVVDISWRMNNK